MKDTVIFAALGLLVLSSLSSWTAIYDRTHAGGEEEPELAVYMGQLQRYLQKAQLASEAGNNELTGFYVHELEELSEAIVATVPRYEGHPIGELTERLLMPAIASVEAALHAGRNPDPELGNTLSSCNACHRATEHAHIKITAQTNNPFNQDFSP